MKDANDAETVAHDALASIDARADEITDSMNKTKTLQNDNSKLKFSLEATRKALDVIDSKEKRKRRRQRRRAEAQAEDGQLQPFEAGAAVEANGGDEEQDFSSRLQALSARQERIMGLRESLKSMRDILKERVKEARESIKR